MIVTAHPSRIDGALVAPPSKSVMLRVVAAALLADGARTTIRNPSRCEDVLSGLRVIEGLGAEVRALPEEVVIEGGLRVRDRLLDCGESGLCLRMFTAIAALSGEEITLTGREPLRRRPATPVEEPLAALGARGRTSGGFPPIVVRGPLDGGEAEVDGALSSQFLSGLLLALPLVERDSVLQVRDLTSRPYVNLTLSLLERFGTRVEHEGDEQFEIPGGQRYRIGEHHVEGDWSAAAFLLVLGALGGAIRVGGLDLRSEQADRRVLEVLEAAGARVVRGDDAVEVAREELRAFAFDATDAPDLLPPLAALACHCEGTSVFTGVRRLQHKECSRAEVVARELMAVGAGVELEEDRLSIRGASIQGGEARSHGDHRVAMALAAAAVAARGPITIDGAEHVAKSYPGFFTDLSSVRAS